MPWPLSQDYNESIQNPSSCFSDPDLKQGEAVCNALGLPQPCSGNFADVYAVQAVARKWAVKCFTRQIPGLRERYAQISRYLQQVKLPFMVDFQFLEQGIRVRADWYPILKMQWVEGFQLNTFVRDNLDKPQLLQNLCPIWLKMASALRAAHLAHGDLQHGNVLLVPSKAGSVGLRLVDYDGMCVPALELLKSVELGHASYQHPQRLREGGYGLHIDRFSHLVIYTALRGLALGGQPLWEKFDNGDNLLFKQKDFEEPRGSEVFKALIKLDDPEVRQLAQAISIASQKPLEQTPLLEDLVGGGQAVTVRRKAMPVGMPAALPVDIEALPATERGRFRGQRRSPKRPLARVLAGSLVLAGIAAGGMMVATHLEPKETGQEVVVVQTQAATEPKRAETSPPEPKKELEPKKDPPPKEPEPKPKEPEPKPKEPDPKPKEPEPKPKEPEPKPKEPDPKPKEPEPKPKEPEPKPKEPEPKPKEPEPKPKEPEPKPKKEPDLDPIKIKLDKAKADYRAEVDKLHRQLLESLDKAEEAARQAGNKKVVDQIKEERDELQKDGTLPTVVSMKDYQKQRIKALRTALAAYRSAIAEYTKAKQDAAAAAVQTDPLFAELARLEPVDLLALVNADKDTVSGKWGFKDKTLISASTGRCRLQIRYIPPEEYTIAVVTKQMEGDSFGIGIVVGGKQCVASVDGWPKDGFRSGLQVIDGKASNNNETTHKGQILKKGKTSEIVCSVRKTGVTVTVDGKTIFAFKGDSSRLSTSPEWAVPNPRTLMVGTCDSVQYITKIELTPISGRGSLLER